MHAALESLVSLPVSLSRIDRHVNSRNKGKGRQDDSDVVSEPASTTTSPAPLETPEVDNTPADGVSDLAPAPTPEGLVPSSELPTKPAAPRVAYDLPDGLDIEDCAIFYLGGESLGLNNLLMTHGKCSVCSSSFPPFAVQS